MPVTEPELIFFASITTSPGRNSSEHLFFLIFANISLLLKPETVIWLQLQLPPDEIHLYKSSVPWYPNISRVLRPAKTSVSVTEHEIMFLLELQLPTLTKFLSTRLFSDYSRILVYHWNLKPKVPVTYPGNNYLASITAPYPDEIPEYTPVSWL